jgi:hypothetical protein
MGNLDLTGTLKALTGERTHVLKELAKLDRAIAVIQDLVGINSTTNGNSSKRTISAAARKKMAIAQKARWAKVKQAQKAKLAK